MRWRVGGLTLSEQRRIAGNPKALAAPNAAKHDPLGQRSDPEHAELNPSPKGVFRLLSHLGMTSRVAAGALPLAHSRTIGANCRAAKPDAREARERECGAFLGRVAAAWTLHLGF